MVAEVLVERTIKCAEDHLLENIVVVGGGFSGVETIGELREMSGRLLPYYKNISENELKFHIVEFSDKLLPELSDEILKTYRSSSSGDRSKLLNYFIQKRLRNLTESIGEF